jgi:glycosyltransferase involved in cell wall biosynthesis
MTATFYAVRGGNDTFWRVEAPAKAVGGRAVIVPEADAQTVFSYPQADGPFPWSFTPEADVIDIDYPEHRGTAVWTRPDPMRAVHIAAMRHLGVLTVAEVDDNYLSNPRLNIFMRVNRLTEETQRLHLESLASADRAVFSTVWLRDHYMRSLKQAGLPQPEPFVCRNNIDRADWPEPVPREGPLRVGWMGSPAHVWDVDLAWAALLHARNLGCETWLIGYNPAEGEGTHPRSVHKRAQWRKVRAKHIPWTDPGEYHRRPLPLDIGLCPLLRNKHTLGKSDVKFIEYTISGAATIAMNNEVYNRTIVHGETGLLVGSPEEMLRAVDRLVRDERLRETLVANARQYVEEERGLRQLREEWGAAIA